MASPFQRTSSFDQPVVERRPRVADRSEKPKVPDGDSLVSREELERWYRVLLDVLERESDGDMDHTTELTDLRDDIYARLY
jgi:hypothetical protein